VSGEAPIVGCDLGLGGGARVALLPCVPNEILLINSDAAYTAGEGSRTVTLDLWGLDPRLDVALAFSRSSAAAMRRDSSAWQVTATIRAYTIVKSTFGTLLGPEIPAASLWANGGQLDAAGGDDGCELCTGSQGVRFVLTASRTGQASTNIVATAICRPNVALVCPELALALFGGVSISIPTAQGW
jgi:hypothetical protein